MFPSVLVLLLCVYENLVGLGVIRSLEHVQHGGDAEQRFLHAAALATAHAAGVGRRLLELRPEPGRLLLHADRPGTAGGLLRAGARRDVQRP